jgi:hypothetical protein
MKHDHPVPAGPRPGFWTTRNGMALLTLLAAGAFYLLAEHRAHAWGVLPYLLILACPLMHLFMHRGHRRDH